MPDTDNRLATVKYTRIPTLDGWRAVAIIAVMCHHIRWPFLTLERFSAYGSDLGVKLFFALSGFLITSRLLDEYDQLGAIQWKEFYLRRAFRILPPAFFFLAVLAALGFGLHVIPFSAKQLVSSVFFYRNYLPNTAATWYTAHFWTLAVEEQFYLFWPAILILVCVARGARAAIALACLVELWREADMHYNWVAHFWPALHGILRRTDYSIGQLFLGCVLAFLWRSNTARAVLKRYVRSYWVVGAVLGQILLLRYKPLGYYAGVELLMTILPLATVADSKGIVSRVLETRLLTWIGRLSYSLYLWQQLFIPMWAIPMAFGIAQSFPLNVILAISAAAFSYYFVEQPFIRLGKRLQNRSRAIREPVLQSAPVS